MKLNVYRKRYVFGYAITDDEPEAVYECSAILHTGGSIVLRCTSGEKTIKKDDFNYKYIVTDGSAFRPTFAI